MKVVAQRVTKASVSVDNELISQIDKGLLVLVGLHKNDTVDRFDYFIKKIMNLRVFEDGENKMNRSLVDNSLSVLLVSQFTLYGDCKKGNRPSFINAMPPAEAKELYKKFVDRFRELYEEDKVKDGVFGAYMQVELLNDGPVTIILEETPGSL